jgi:hypothetical protein
MGVMGIMCWRSVTWGLLRCCRYTFTPWRRLTVSFACVNSE